MVDEADYKWVAAVNKALSEAHEAAVLEAEKFRKENEQLRDLVQNLWLYIGRYEETQLTTEQKELLYDVANNDGKRWWHG